jgi:hypothetical protein
MNQLGLFFSRRCIRQKATTRTTNSCPYSNAKRYAYGTAQKSNGTTNSGAGQSTSKYSTANPYIATTPIVGFVGGPCVRCHLILATLIIINRQLIINTLQYYSYQSCIALKLIRQQ